MQTILLYTATGQYNLGDEVITQAEIEFLGEKIPSVTIVLPTYNPESVLKKSSRVVYRSYFPNAITKKPIANLLAAWFLIWDTFRSSAVLIGGGGLIFDREAGKSFGRLINQWKLRVWIAKLFGKPIYTVGLWVYIKPEHYGALKFLQGKNIHISVRDTASQEALAAIGVMAHIVPDAAFLLAPATHNNNPATKISHQTVGLALRAGYLPQGETDIQKILQSIQTRQGTPIFLPHSLHPTDPHANDAKYVEQIANQYHIQQTSTIQESFAQYASLDGMVAMRLHAMILAAIHGVPFVGISYETKTKEFLQMIEYPYYLEAWAYTNEAFDTLWNEVWQNRERVRFELTQKYDTIRAEAQTRYETFFTDYGLFHP